MAAQAASGNKDTCHTSWKITRAAKLSCYYPIFHDYNCNDPKLFSTCNQCTEKVCKGITTKPKQAKGKCKALNCLFAQPTQTLVAMMMLGGGPPEVSWTTLDSAEYANDGPFDKEGNYNQSTKAFKVYSYPTTTDAQVEAKQINIK